MQDLEPENCVQAFHMIQSCRISMQITHMWTTSEERKKASNCRSNITCYLEQGLESGGINDDNRFPWRSWRPNAIYIVLEHISI